MRIQSPLLSPDIYDAKTIRAAVADPPQGAHVSVVELARCSRLVVEVEGDQMSAAEHYLRETLNAILTMSLERKLASA